MSTQGEPTNQPPPDQSGYAPPDQPGAAPQGPPGYPPPGAQPGYPPAAQPAPYGGGLAGRGPIGEPRSAGTVVILSIITLGIYNIYWQYKTFQEMKDYSGQGLGGGIALILAIFVGFVNPFIMGSEIANIYRAEGQEPPVSAATGAWILLPIVGGIIWIVKCQGALNDLWVAHGATAR